MADEQDPFADLGFNDDPFEDAVPKANVRVMAYGPVVGEHHRAAMFGPEGNALQPYDVAASPNLGLKLGEWIEVNGQARRVADWSYIKPGVPTKDTIEIRDDKDQGHGTINRINLTPEEIQKRISEYPQLAGERTTGSERKASEPSDVQGDPFADLIPEKKAVGRDPFADLTPPPARGFKGLSPSPTIEEPSPSPIIEPPSPTPTQTVPPRVGPTPMPPPSAAPQLQFTPPTFPAPQVIPQQGSQVNELIPTPLPSPQGAEDEPDVMQKAVRALAAYGGQMIPRSVEQAVQMTGVPTDLTDPFADLGFLFPPARASIDIGRQAIHRMQQIREAENTPPLSQQRFDAGIGTVLDLAGMAGTIGGVRAGMRPRPTTVKPPSISGIVATTREVPVPESFQPRGTTVSEVPPTVPPPRERPAPQPHEPLHFAVDMPTDTFGTEHTPIASAVMELGGVMSKSNARKSGHYAKTPELWDGAPRLSHPTHNKIYRGNERPDIVAQSLYDAGLIRDPYVDTMWEALDSESKASRSTLKSQRSETQMVARGLKEKAQQTENFAKAQVKGWKEGDPVVPVKDLQVGDTVEIGGEKFKVTDIDPDTFDVTLEDGRKFGVQTVSDQTVIYGEHESIYGEPPVSEPPPVDPPTERPPPAEPTPPPVPQGSETVNPVRGSGKFVRSYRIDKELGDRMEGIGAARESGALRAETEARNLLDGLTLAQETDLGRLLVSDRMKGVNSDHPQIISGIEARRIESDPAIKKAIDYYRKQIEPDVEQWHKRAGTSEESIAPQRGHYIALIPKTMELIPQQTTTGRFINPATLPRTTVFARAASGFAKEYSVNVRDILTETYGEVIRKARTREFYDAAVRKGVMNKATVRMPDGNFVKVAQFDDLPPQLQHDLTEATKANLAPVGLQKVGRIYQRAVTGAALTANPAELVNHMRRQLNLVASKPPIGMGLLARLEALVPYFGPKLGAFKRTIMDNMSTPENQAILRDIYDAGGGSSRSFEELYGAHPKKPFFQALHKYSGLEWLQRKTQNLLFGIPRGYGVSGWDLRMRVQLEKIRRAAEGNVDPQRIREFANQIGQYGRHTSWAVSALRAINPYAATTLPMRLTELKTAIGSTGLKEKPLSARTLAHRGETLARGTGGTILALTTANYLLSGKWPWENDKGHEFDLNTGVSSKDGKTVYVKLRAIAPELSRPVSTAAIPDLLRERSAKHPQYLSAAATGPLNQGASLVSGPGQNLLLTAASGKVPYFLKRPGEGPELMDVAMLRKGERGQSRGLRQLKAAAAGVNPFGELFGPQFNVEVDGGLQYLEEPIHGIKPFGRIFSTSYERKHGSGAVLPPPPPPAPPSLR